MLSAHGEERGVKISGKLHMQIEWTHELYSRILSDTSSQDAASTTTTTTTTAALATCPLVSLLRSTQQITEICYDHISELI